MFELTCTNCGASLQVATKGEGYRCDYCGTEITPPQVEEAELIPEAPLLAERIPERGPDVTQAPAQQPSARPMIDPTVAQVGSTLLGIPRMIQGCISAIFVIAFLGCFGSIVVSSQCASDRRQDKYAVKRTDEQLTSGVERIDSVAKRLQRLPNNVEGTRNVRSLRDGWQNELGYERLSETEFKIISAGPDERMGTGDDMEKKASIELDSPH